MEITAVSRGSRISPRKARLIADVIRNVSAKRGLYVLSLINKRAAKIIEKTLKSAIANAVSNKKLEENNLFIKAVEVFQGPALKRYHPSTRGRIHPYKKRTSHIKIVLEEKGAYGTES